MSTSGPDNTDNGNPFSSYQGNIYNSQLGSTNEPTDSTMDTASIKQMSSRHQSLREMADTNSVLADSRAKLGQVYQDHVARAQSNDYSILQTDVPSFGRDIQEAGAKQLSHNPGAAQAYRQQFEGDLLQTQNNLQAHINNTALNYYKTSFNMEQSGLLNKAQINPEIPNDDIVKEYSQKLDAAKELGLFNDQEVGKMKQSFQANLDLADASSIAKEQRNYYDPNKGPEENFKNAHDRIQTLVDQGAIPQELQPYVMAKVQSSYNTTDAILKIQKARDSAIQGSMGQGLSAEHEARYQNQIDALSMGLQIDDVKFQDGLNKYMDSINRKAMQLGQLNQSVQASKMGGLSKLDPIEQAQQELNDAQLQRTMQGTWGSNDTDGGNSSSTLDMINKMQQYYSSKIDKDLKNASALAKFAVQPAKVREAVLNSTAVWGSGDTAGGKYIRYEIGPTEAQKEEDNRKLDTAGMTSEELSQDNFGMTHVISKEEAAIEKDNADNYNQKVKLNAKIQKEVAKDPMGFAASQRVIPPTKQIDWTDIKSLGASLQDRSATARVVGEHYNLPNVNPFTKDETKDLANRFNRGSPSEQLQVLKTITASLPREQSQALMEAIGGKHGLENIQSSSVLLQQGNEVAAEHNLAGSQLKQNKDIHLPNDVNPSLQPLYQDNTIAPTFGDGSYQASMNKAIGNIYASLAMQKGVFPTDPQTGKPSIDPTILKQAAIEAQGGPSIQLGSKGSYIAPPYYGATEKDVKDIVSTISPNDYSDAGFKDKASMQNYLQSATWMQIRPGAYVVGQTKQTAQGITTTYLKDKNGMPIVIDFRELLSE